MASDITELAQPLAFAAGRLLNSRPIAVTVDGDRLLIDQRTAAALHTPLRRAPDGAGDRAAGLITSSRAPEGAAFSPDTARTLTRLLDESERAVTRLRQIERGIIPGALSAREAMIVTRRMHGLR